MRRSYNSPKFLTILFLFLLSVTMPFKGYGLEKVITTTVGSTFTVNPWNDIKSEFPDYVCASTSCIANNYLAFSINESSRTNTTLPEGITVEGSSTGFYAKYTIQALEAGIYAIFGDFFAFKMTASYGGIHDNVNGKVIYHIIVNEKEPVVTSITMPNTLDISDGKSYTFKPVIVADEGANTTLTWTSSKPEVISVTSDGLINALAVGRSVITCTASNGITAKCTVTVNPIAVTGVGVNYAELQINTGEKKYLSTSITPSNATNKEVTWSSSNANIALVGFDGTVAGVNEGYCNIIATANDGSGKKSSCMVHVISQSVSGDVNKDGDVSISDVTALIAYLLNGGNNNHQFTVNGVSFTMIPIQGGTFTMGATAEQGDEATDKEKPTHQVTLSNFNIGETPVTQELWEAVMGSNPSSFIGDPHRPVEMVSWEDCQIFIATLNSLTGKHFRLPTEAEWEYAARGGNRSLGFKFAGSSNLDEVGWYTTNSASTTHAVKMKNPNELGLFDMCGNVLEWCSDWYDVYSNESQTNPTGPETGTTRIRRGGAWSSEETLCRVSFRTNKAPSFKNASTGLRLAL